MDAVIEPLKHTGRIIGTYVILGFNWEFIGVGGGFSAPDGLRLSSVREILSAGILVGFVSHSIKMQIE